MHAPSDLHIVLRLSPGRLGQCLQEHEEQWLGCAAGVFRNHCSADAGKPLKTHGIGTCYDFTAASVAHLHLVFMPIVHAW
jgi:hypothetical protein